MVQLTRPVDRRDYLRQYSRQWVAERRSSFFADKTCVRCGTHDQLELDHIDPATKVSNSIWSWSESRRVVEITKCQVLCHRCHLIKSREDRKPPHGSNNRYTSHIHRCRCQPCRDAHASVNARYR